MAKNKKKRNYGENVIEKVRSKTSQKSKQRRHVKKCQAFDGGKDDDDGNVKTAQPAPTASPLSIFNDQTILKSSGRSTIITNKKTSGLFSSIFGNDDGTTNGSTNDLFSSTKAHELEEVSQQWIVQNKAATSTIATNSLNRKGEEPELKNMTEDKNERIKKILSPQDIIESRKKRNCSSNESFQLVQSITVTLPHTFDYGSGDKNSVEDDGYKSSSCSSTENDNQEIMDMNDTNITNEGSKRIFVGQCDSIFREHGVLIIKPPSSSSAALGRPSLFSSKLLDKLTAQSKHIEREVCHRLEQVGKHWRPDPSPTSTALTHSQHQKVTINQKTGKEEDYDDKYIFRYHEVASRCRGRLDIRHLMNHYPFNDKNVTSNSYLLPLVQSLLGGGNNTQNDVSKLVYAGLILSFPESDDQPWHQDGTSLFEDWELMMMIDQQRQQQEANNDNDNDQEVMMDLPPYALNIFIPLEDVTEDIGPTEFWVGSHLAGRAKEIMARLSRRADDTRFHEEEERAGIIGPTLKRGDVLLYDYRICHRGTKNLSSVSQESSDSVGGGFAKTRPMLYLMYARPWFNEHINFGTERLFVD